MFRVQDFALIYKEMDRSREREGEQESGTEGEREVGREDGTGRGREFRVWV